MTGALMHVVLPLVVLVAGAWGVVTLMDTPKRPERRPAEKQAPLVEVAVAQVAREPVQIVAMGTVRPAASIELRPQVAGRVASVADGLEPGGVFSKGQALFTIDERDYALALEQAKADVRAAEAAIPVAKRQLRTAELELAVEEGNQAVAKRESALFGDDLPPTNRSLALREPHLAAARAAIDGARGQIRSAEAALAAAVARRDAAELNLARTTLAAPADVVIEERLVDVGETVSPTTPMARLVATDVFWVDVAVPERDLRWLRVPGSEVKLSNAAAWGEGVERSGRVIRRLPSVDPAGRMARVLVEVADPLALEPANAALPPVLAGSYLRAQIVGIPLEEAIVVSRNHLREGDVVWVMTEASALSVREVDVLYRGPERVLVGSGVKAGERIVVTPLATPVDGMKLRTAEPGPGGTEEAHR
jgi:RND family efflux transporter MFP subunit